MMLVLEFLVLDAWQKLEKGLKIPEYMQWSSKVDFTMCVYGI